MSAEMIAKIEQGRKGPSAASLNSLAFALGLEVMDLSERSHAWQAAAGVGLGASALRAGTIAGALTGATAVGAGLGLAWPLAGGLAARSIIRSQRQRREVEHALRDRLRDLSDEDLTRVAEALGVDAED